MAGPPLTELEAIATDLDAELIYSGGVGTLEHLRSLAALRLPALGGAIVGRALYEGRFSVAEALEALGESPRMPSMPTAASRISWGLALQLLREALERGSAAWEALGPKGRRRAQALLTKSKGNPRNLTDKERKELMDLAKTVGTAPFKGKPK